MHETAYEIRNCDWSSDVCSSDLIGPETEAETKIKQEKGQRGSRKETVIKTYT